LHHPATQSCPLGITALVFLQLFRLEHPQIEILHTPQQHPQIEVKGQGELVTHKNRQIHHGWLGMGNKIEAIDSGVMAMHRWMGLIDLWILLRPPQMPLLERGGEPLPKQHNRLKLFPIDQAGAETRELLPMLLL
jgi:hypothetical protein